MEAKKAREEIKGKIDQQISTRNLPAPSEGNHRNVKQRVKHEDEGVGQGSRRGNMGMGVEEGMP